MTTPNDDQGAPLHAGPVLTSTYRLSGEPAGGYQYGRWTNPTWSALETELAALELVPGLRVFASGQAATAAVLATSCPPGSVLVLPADGYPATRGFASAYLAPAGVTIRQYDSPHAVEQLPNLVDGAALVWVETPSNPRLDVVDIAACAELAHAAGALLAVDNTTATPRLQQPARHGADLVVASGTKAVNGHSDVVMGYAGAVDDRLLDRLHQWRSLVGAVLGPSEAWLVLRSLATLALRVDRQSATAAALAAAFAAHPAVHAVHYPGRASAGAAALVARQMPRGGGPLVTIDLGSRAAAERFLAAAPLIEATSFGGTLTTGERRARWQGDEVPPGLVRISVGLDDPDRLLTGFLAALDPAR